VFSEKKYEAGRVVREGAPGKIRGCGPVRKCVFKSVWSACATGQCPGAGPGSAPCLEESLLGGTGNCGV